MFLQAIEDEQWDQLPGGVFNRGFVRAVARYLGLDEENIVAEYAGNEPEVLRRDFFNSLRAAYRPPEIREQLILAGIESFRVEAVSDRHVIVYGTLP